MIWPGPDHMSGTRGASASSPSARIARFTYDAFGNVVRTAVFSLTGMRLADSRTTFDLLGRKLTESEWIDIAPQ